MSSLPRISVVTVCFNAAEVIEKTIISVVNQTYENLEYLIIDGASKDNTLEIVEKYRTQIEKCGKIISEPDKGLYDAMNKGVFACSGDYVIMMNADDVFHDENVVTDVAQFIHDNPDCDAVFGNTEQIWDYGTFIARPTEAYRNHKMCISPQATFARTKLMREHPFNLKYRYAADFEQFSSMILEGRRFVHFDRIIATVAMSSGVTFDNHYASAAEIYSIIESQGFDVSKEKKKKLRNIKLVGKFRKAMPSWISRPVMHLIAKLYKPM